MIQKIISWFKRLWQPDTKMVHVEHLEDDGQPVVRMTLSEALIEQMRERNTTEPY